MEALTVQRLLEQHLQDILARNAFPAYQQKALRKLSVCRTQALGGHAQYCAAGHLNGVWYNSCKHRACPQCQGIANERWLRNTQSILLDCPHHHVIFTLPSALNPLWRYVKGGPFRPWQLQQVSHGRVRFCYRSHQTGCLESLDLSQDAFAQRLAEHVPVPRKPGVRYYGLYASPCRDKLNQARQALGQQAVSQHELLSWQAWLEEKGHRPTCDVCGLPLFHAEKTDAVRRAA